MAKKHQVVDHDHIAAIARRYGFISWRSVWEDKVNNSLRAKRSNPNLLFKGDKFHKGDVVSIPEKTKEQKKATSGKHHPFLVSTNEVFVRLRILADDFSPLKDAPYELAVEGSKAAPLTGKTDAKGQFEVKVPLDAKLATLTVRMSAEKSDAGQPEGPHQGQVRSEVPVTWSLELASLNPIGEQAPDAECLSGVQARLNNLGLNTGPVDGILGPNTRASLEAFQTLFGLTVTKKPDAATQAKLQEVHDKPDSHVSPTPPSGT